MLFCLSEKKGASESYLPGGRGAIRETHRVSMLAPRERRQATNCWPSVVAVPREVWWRECADVRGCRKVRGTNSGSTTGLSASCPTIRVQPSGEGKKGQSISATSDVSNMVPHPKRTVPSRKTRKTSVRRSALCAALRLASDIVNAQGKANAR